MESETWLSPSEKRELRSLGWPVGNSQNVAVVEAPCEADPVTPPYEPTPVDELEGDLIFPVDPALDTLLESLDERK